MLLKKSSIRKASHTGTSAEVQTGAYHTVRSELQLFMGRVDDALSLTNEIDRLSPLHEQLVCIKGLLCEIGDQMDSPLVDGIDPGIAVMIVQENLAPDLLEELDALDYVFSDSDKQHELPEPLVAPLSSLDEEPVSRSTSACRPPGVINTILDDTDEEMDGCFAQEQHFSYGSPSSAKDLETVGSRLIEQVYRDGLKVHSALCLMRK